MDPITIVAAVVSVSTVIIGLSRVVQKINSINDPAFQNQTKLVKTKLVSDRRKFVNWSVALGIREVQDLEPSVQPEDFKVVVECFQDVQYAILLATEKVHKLDTIEKTSTGRLKSKVRWRFRDFDELKLLVDTLREMVDTLYIIAPPPPPWYPRDVEPQPRQPQPASPFMYRNNSEAPDQAQGSSSERDNRETENHFKLMSSTPIFNLYGKCRSALHLIRMKTEGSPEGAVAEKASYRFRIWGTDIVDGPFALDKVMKADAQQNDDLDFVRTAIITVLVDIALLEDQVLGFLSLTCDDSDRRRVEELQLEVIAILGMGGVEGIAAQRPVPYVSDEEGKCVLSKAANRLLLAVEGLYDLSPAIRSARREHLLLIEESSDSKGKLLLGSATTTKARQDARLLAPSEDASLTEWVDWSVDTTTYMELQLYHKMKDDANESSSTDKRHYEILKKQSEKLKEWADSISKTKTGSLGNGKEEEDIKKILMAHKQNLPVTKKSSADGNVELNLDEKALLTYVEGMKATNENLSNLDVRDALPFY